MRKFVLFLFLFFPILGNALDWKNAKLSQLDTEQFRRLEQGEKNLEEIPNLIIEKSNSKTSVYLINAYTILGIVNKNKGFYVSSLNYHLLALSSAKRLNDTGRISACLNNIGTLYLLQENYQKAIDFFNKSLQIEDKSTRIDQKSIRLYNLGDAYVRLEQYDEALSYFTSSLLLEKKLNNKLGISYALLGQANVYAGLKRISDLRNALGQINKNDLDEEGRLDYYLVLGRCFQLEGNLNESISIYQKGIDEAKQTDSKPKLAALYLNLAELYENKGESSNAVDSYKKHIYLYKSLQSNQIKNQLEDLTYQNELKQKELEIVYLKEQKKLAAENAISIQKLRSFEWKIVIIAIASLICFVIITLVSIKRIVSLKS